MTAYRAKKKAQQELYGRVREAAVRLWARDGIEIDVDFAIVDESDCFDGWTVQAWVRVNKADVPESEART